MQQLSKCVNIEFYDVMPRHSVFFKTNLLLQKWLAGTVVTKEKIEEAKSIVDVHLGPGLFNYNGQYRCLNIKFVCKMLACYFFYHATVYYAQVCFLITRKQICQFYKLAFLLQHFIVSSPVLFLISLFYPSTKMSAHCHMLS